MFRPSIIIIEEFIHQLDQDYLAAFGNREPVHRQTITDVARSALPHIARSDALYHNLDHAILVSQVGCDILRGRIVRDGDVDSLDWVHFISSLLCFSVGMVREACPGDQGNTCVVGSNNETVEIPRGATDGYLWRYLADRSKIYVESHYRNHSILNVDRLMQNIEYARFPPPADENLNTKTFPGLLRASQIIGSVADPNFMLKTPALMMEMDESGMTEILGFKTVVEWKTNYPNYFWTSLHSYIADGMEYLKYTGQGHMWLATLHAHVLKQEQDRNQ